MKNKQHSKQQKKKQQAHKQQQNSNRRSTDSAWAKKCGSRDSSMCSGDSAKNAEALAQTAEESWAASSSIVEAVVYRKQEQK